MVTFQLETWTQYYNDVQELWQKHYVELCSDPIRMPMGPDVIFYSNAETQGMLQIVTARSVGKLVGYQISVVRPHPHYCSVLCGFEDSFWLDPEYRKGMAGVKLISESLKFAKARGVKRVFYMSNEGKPTGRLFDFLKFKKTHTVHSKWIGD